MSYTAVIKNNGPSPTTGVKLTQSQLGTTGLIVAVSASQGSATVADPVVEPKIIADHRDLCQCVRPIADQSRPFDRWSDLPVLDQIRLGGGEHEFA